ncbi:MAG: ABC transporter substrate-binding protein [Verrucomicrobiota bacterium]
MQKLLSRRHTGAWIVASGLLFLNACDAPDTEQTQTLTYAAYTDVKEWDPSYAFSTESLVLLNIYEGLTLYDPSYPDDPVRPRLAESWEVSEDGLTWSFKLRPGVTFHDGEPCDASAVKASLERTIAEGSGAFYIFEGIESIEAVDPLTLRITTAKPMPLDLISSAQYGTYIFSPKAAAKGKSWFNEGNAVGTGPYRLRQWNRNQQVVLERFEDYWGGWDPGQYERVIIKIVLEPSTRLQLLLAGQADIIPFLRSELTEPLSKNEKIVIERVPSWKNVLFLINTDKAPTDNLLFRRALTHAWDYDGIIEATYGSGATRPQGPVPGTLWGNFTDAVLPAYDLELARELIEASGVPPEKRKLTLSYIHGVDAYRAAAEIYQASLADIGIELELRPGPAWGQIWDQAKNPRTAPNMISMTWWPTWPTPADWLIGLFRTEDPPLFNLSYYSNPKYDETLEAAIVATSTDREQAIKYFQEAQRILQDDAVAIYVADVQDQLVYRRGLRDVRSNPAYNTVFFYNVRAPLPAQP